MIKSIVDSLNQRSVTGTAHEKVENKPYKKDYGEIPDE